MDDVINENLIDSFRPRLKVFIAVDPVLDRLHFISADQKECVRQKAKTEGNSAAVDALISAVLRKPHPEGWFQAFVDALSSAGCKRAAEYLRVELPDPKVEAENDYCMRMMDILVPRLLDMDTKEVCTTCFSRELISEDDKDIILRLADTQGSRDGARELLKRIVRCQNGWYSEFVQILRETEHQQLYELMGGSCDWDQTDLYRSPVTRANFRRQSLELLPPDLKASRKLEDETTVGDAVMDSPAESSPGPQCLDDYKDMETENDATERSYLGAASGGPERAAIVLRDYQKEVAQPALEGKNIIICLPTGSGKTRVAVYVTNQHLKRRRAEGNLGKVVVLVNKVPLVEQHYTTEFHPFLKHAYKVERVSGNSMLKIPFADVLKTNDVVICTAQILENYLERSVKGEDQGVHLKDISLIIIDECHHTNKGEVYNKVMMRYLKQKEKNIALKKEQKETLPLPQILGLTASLGVGSATKLDKAEKNILQICANLDASQILSSDLGEYRNEPGKQIVHVEDKEEDPFGDVIKKIMNTIHTYAKLNPICELGSQKYEQWVVQCERQAAKEEDQTVRICAEHLRRYNEALQLSNTIRMCDAFNFLKKYHKEERNSKRSPDEEHINITDTENMLFKLFQDNEEELQELSKNQSYENDSLSKLRVIILRQFSNRKEARGIIFTKTRHSAKALKQWIQDNPKFADLDVNASYIIGGGDQSFVKPMTAAEQKDVLSKFHSGAVNLLIATSVAEEGLDIPACNFVIRYGLVTNENAMIQARGRARAKDSSYIVIEVKGSGVTEKETVNEYRMDLMTKAIARIRKFQPEEYKKRIEEFQIQATIENTVRRTKVNKKDKKVEKPSEVKLTCRKCSKLVCTGDDIELIEGMHHVNVSEAFRQLFTQIGNPALPPLLDCEINSLIACKECGQKWGTMMVFRGIECPSLHVKNFVVTIKGKNISNYTKWNELAIKFPAFDYVQHGRRFAQMLHDEETEG